ncbi:MAG: class F sortase [Propionibacteriales bacterium]|nr:class F sortase [Propionibacteriales bacterium]
MSKRLFVLILAMVIAGFAIPSPGAGSAGPGYGDNSQYHPLGKVANPELLIIPSIKLNAPIVPIDLRTDGVLSPPSDFTEVGYWTGSAKPGATRGQTVLTGHTVHTGGGVMNRLGDLRPGGLVQVRTKRGTVDYAVTKVFVYTKAQLAKHKLEVLGQDREDYRLVLVTCIDWNGREYESNVIVYADELGVHN